MRSRNVTIWVMMLICLSGMCKTTMVEWSIDDGGNGHFYEAVLATDGIDWESANVAEIEAGGYLATLTSAAENAFAFDLVKDDINFWHGVPNSHNPSFIYWEGPWLGGVREPDGTWGWVTGEPFIYTNWAPGEPTDVPAADRLAFFGYGSIANPEWNDDKHGESSYKGYIVEYIPEPTTFLLLGLGAVMVKRSRK
ncbi:MAG: PEP-CTERM sorting domain-containing protein [Sedimentisphaerales bacterium]|nr:PEP-CTERM sorting domain-containing protein [Sedimentisphaerales bacterium]